MNPSLSYMWKHMLKMGISALTHSNRHAAYIDMDNGNWEAFSVLQSAHAAELFLKARIAQEHPLLIFDRLPKPSQTKNKLLEIDDLIQKGKTLIWSDLPEKLWQVTGIQLPDDKRFIEFGHLRNNIQHFGVLKGIDLASEALRFNFEVIDPFINECWNLCSIDYDEDHEQYTYFVPSVVDRNITFNVSQNFIEHLQRYHAEEMDHYWSSASEKYKNTMNNCLQNALGIYQ